MDVISTRNLRSEPDPSAHHLLSNQSVNVDEAAALQRHLPPHASPTSSTRLPHLFHTPLPSRRCQTADAKSFCACDERVSWPRGGTGQTFVSIVPPKQKHELADWCCSLIIISEHVMFANIPTSLPHCKYLAAGPPAQFDTVFEGD